MGNTICADRLRWHFGRPRRDLHLSLASPRRPASLPVGHLLLSPSSFAAQKQTTVGDTKAVGSLLPNFMSDRPTHSTWRTGARSSLLARSALIRCPRRQRERGHIAKSGHDALLYVVVLPATPRSFLRYSREDGRTDGRRRRDNATTTETGKRLPPADHPAGGRNTPTKSTSSLP